MALSRDRGTASQSIDQGYGLVRTLQGTAPPDDLIVVSTNQEHGVLALRAGCVLDLSRYPVSTLLRILPNHACAAAAPYDRYYVVAGEQAIVRTAWQRFNGW